MALIDPKRSDVNLKKTPELLLTLSLKIIKRQVKFLE